MKNASFRPDIEGLRALAILLVVLYHAEIPGFTGGYVGVDVFFVLSGYLITRLLRAEYEERGRLDLMRFYARRIQRLLPAGALMTLGVALASAWLVAPQEQRKIAASSVFSSLYASNVWFAYRADDYLGGGTDGNPMLHTWSLTVEEQFYLVWPMLVFAALRLPSRPGRVSPLLLVMSAVTFFGFAACWVTTDLMQPYAFFLTPLRAWEFAIGAMACRLGPGVRDRIAPHAAPLAVVCLLGIVAVGVGFDERTAFPGPFALVPALATIGMLVAGDAAPDNFVSKALGTVVPMELGRLSYSWYLWHWPFLVLLVPEGWNPLLLLLASLVVAKASFTWVEQPLRHHPRLAKSSVALAFGAAVTVMMAGAGVGWREGASIWQRQGAQGVLTKAMAARPGVYRSDCHVKWSGTESKLSRCQWGDVGAPHVVLLGDSHAAQWFPALEKEADEGRIRLTSLTKSACQPIPIEQWSQSRRREYHECKTWVEGSVASLLELEPDVVVFTGRDTEETTVADWTLGLEYLVAQTRQKKTKIVVLADVPAIDDAPSACAARVTWSGGDVEARCSFSSLNGGRIQAAARAVASDRLHLVDPTDWVCSDESGEACSPLIGGIPVWRDESHISVPMARALSQQFGQAVLEGRL